MLVDVRQVADEGLYQDKEGVNTQHEVDDDALYSISRGSTF